MTHFQMVSFFVSICEMKHCISFTLFAYTNKNNHIITHPLFGGR